MDRRTIILGFAGLLLLSGIASGAVLLMQHSDASVTPDTLAGYEMTENVTGDEARAVIFELHENPAGLEGFDRGIVAKYGEPGPDQIVLYASVYNETEDADREIEAMAQRIRGTPGFGVETETVGEVQVYTAARGEARFAFFSYRRAAYWITHHESLNASTDRLVGTVTDGYSLSNGFPLQTAPVTPHVVSTDVRRTPGAS